MTLRDQARDAAIALAAAVAELEFVVRAPDPFVSHHLERVEDSLAMAHAILQDMAGVVVGSSRRVRVVPAGSGEVATGGKA